MNLTKQTKIIIISVSAVILIAGAVTPTSIVLYNKNHTINFTLLSNAGVMIEAEGMRIYIDPYELPEEYSNYPADAILITHDHGDHYDPASMDLLQKEDTRNVFPVIMTSAITLYDGLAVNPEDTFQVGPIEITCFYMYTVTSHPQASNYTSYIVDIGGFTFFHAGDSWNIDEYTELTGTIDVALLPLGPGCQTMTGIDVVNVLEIIQPTYFIPIHYADGANDDWVDSYESITPCDIVNLAYWESTRFKY